MNPLRRIALVTVLGAAVLSLSGCQFAPLQGVIAPPPPTPTSTPPPSATPEPTFTPTHRPTRTAIPFHALDTILKPAGDLCDQADRSADPVELLEPPYFLIIKGERLGEDGQDVPDWQILPDDPQDIQAASAEDVKTVVCIVQEAHASTTESYDNGAKAVYLYWDIFLVTWPDGRLVGENGFGGSAPPEEISIYASEGVGAPPDIYTLLDWLFPLE